MSWINDQIWKSNQELRPMLQSGEKPEEVEDPEDPEPVIVHHSAMAEIKAGVTSTTIGSEPESSSWADALRKPVEKVSIPTTLWSPTSSWPSTTSNSSSWDSWGWKSTTPWSSAWTLPEPVEDHVAGLPAKMSKHVLISPAAASTSTPSTTKIEESGWTLVAHSRRQTKKTVSWQSTRSPPLDTKRGKSDHRGNKHATRPIGSSKPNRQLVNASLNSDTAPHAGTAKPPTNSKPAPEGSSAAIHWAQLRSAGNQHTRRPD